MTILSYPYQDVIKNILIDIINREFNLQKLNLSVTNGLHNLLNVFSSVDQVFSVMARSAIATLFEKLDHDFRNTPGRTKRYHVKSFHSKTIMTIFGLVTYRRTFYTDLHTRKLYCHVDSFLGLKKHDHYDPYIKAMVVEASCDHSFAAAGRQVSSLIGERVTLEKELVKISRQTARTFTKDATISSVAPVRFKKTPSVLYLMFDEKFIHTQNNHHKDVMIRHAVVFEGIQLKSNHKNRYELMNKHVLASSGAGLNSDILDYLYAVYDIKAIERIYVLGDGAGWIKGGVSLFKMEENISLFALDKYHFKQALRQLMVTDELAASALTLILDDEKKGFIDLCDSLAVQYPHREESITSKRDYIVNNWIAARLSYHENLKCCMEGQISHNIASLFTSRPKGYSKAMIPRLLKNRMAFRNGWNIRKLYLNNFNCKDEKTVGKEHYDFSIFDSLDKKGPVHLSKSVMISLSCRGL